MKASEGKIGRVFMMRLEDGDIVPDCIERFAEQDKVSWGFVLLLGGIGGGEIVSGPRRSEEMPPEPLYLPIDGAHEVLGGGILAPDEKGKPTLHLHAALGRAGTTMTGCLRPGVSIWLVGEAILYEIKGAGMLRIKDKKSGFELLDKP